MKSNIKTYRYLANIFVAHYDAYKSDKITHEFLMYSLYTKLTFSDNMHKNLNMILELFNLLGEKVMKNLLVQLSMDDCNILIIKHKQLFDK
jgi:hypothetical protein